MKEKKSTELLHENINSIVNQISTNGLDCFERPYFLAIEELSEFYVYYRLFFREIDNHIYSDEDEKMLRSYQYDVFTEHYIDTMQSKDWLIEAVNNSRKIIVPIDLFYSEKHIFYYNIKHSAHYLLIERFDPDTDTFIILDEDPEEISMYRDSFNPYYRQRITWESLLAYNTAYGIHCSSEYTDKQQIMFEISLDEKANNPDMQENIIWLFKQIICSFSEKTDYLKKFYLSCIDTFFRYLNLNDHKISLYPLPEGARDLFEHISFFEIIKKILQLTLNKTSFAELENNFYSVISKVQVIKNLIIKQYFSKNKDLSSSIYKKIEVIVSEEIKLYQKIYDKIQTNWNLLKMSEIGYMDRTHISHNDFLDYKFSYIYTVPLEKIFNHKCFSTDGNKTQFKEDFINNNERILINENLNNLINKKETIYNISSVLEDDKLDNISCDGSSIKINDDRSFHSLAILGFSELSNFSEEAIIIFTDNTSQKINLSFSNLLFSPQYNETVYWEGEIIQCEKKIKTPCSIYSTHIFLEQNKAISEIKLPACKNIHILGVDLLQS